MLITGSIFSRITHHVFPTLLRSVRDLRPCGTPTRITYCLLIMLIINTVGCQSVQVEFDGDSAFRFLETQCAFGPRNPGSEGYLNCRDYLVETLTSFADSVYLQPFQYTVNYNEMQQTFNLTNIIAQFNSESETQVLLGAHWDTRPWADMDPDIEKRNKPIIGANDGASGVAVLLELARQMSVNPPPRGVTIVLFDGEDLGERGDPRSYAQGALHFARNLPIPVPEYAIVLDMIGDQDLKIPIERYSYRQNPDLVKKLWQRAKKMKLNAFQNRLGSMIYDDHVPLWEEAKIPAIDLIDFEYPNRYSNYWHTQADIPVKCSPASLQQVGALLVHHLWDKTND